MLYFEVEIPRQLRNFTDNQELTNHAKFLIFCLHEIIKPNLTSILINRCGVRKNSLHHCYSLKSCSSCKGVLEKSFNVIKLLIRISLTISIRQQDAIQTFDI